MKLARGQTIEAVYVTGGGSELPLVSRVLREEFGRKVKRSEYTRSATAIGLAIQADSASGYKLREMFTRNFGVWREGEAGERMIFDPIFPRGTRLPGAAEPPLAVRRRYRPVHNIGDFRYIEASHWARTASRRETSRSGTKFCFPSIPRSAQPSSSKVCRVAFGRLAAEEIEESIRATPREWSTSRSVT